MPELPFAEPEIPALVAQVVAEIEATSTLSDLDLLRIEKTNLDSEIASLQRELDRTPAELGKALESGDQVGHALLEKRAGDLPRMGVFARIQRQRVVLQILRAEEAELQSKAVDLTRSQEQARAEWTEAEREVERRQLAFKLAHANLLNAQTLAREKHEAIRQAQDELSKLTAVPVRVG